MKININGSVYEILRKTEEEYKKLKTLDANGLCECYAKEIILNDEMFSLEKDPQAYANIKLFRNKVLRHEVFHAFFHESGLASDYCGDETLIDWLAIQFPKILGVFTELEVLE